MTNNIAKNDMISKEDKSTVNNNSLMKKIDIAKHQDMTDMIIRANIIPNVENGKDKPFVPDTNPMT